ncbi:MAG: peptidylprolyl isomerase [Clostridia bacterium]|nr:peptidylprolyl isomerase [Clostridia bacterium]
MKLINKTVCIALCAAMVLLSLCSCTMLSSSAREKEPVLTVGEYSVPYELYYYITMNLRKDLPDATEEEIEAEAFEMLREIYGVFALAEEYDISFDDEDVEKVVDEAAQLAIEECGGKKEYKEALGKSYMNDSVFRLLKKHSHVADVVHTSIINSGKYPLDAEKIKALAMSDEFIRVKQILIMTEDSINSAEDTYFTTGEEHTDEEALAIANEAYEKAMAGEDFDSLVDEYGEALHMFNNTDGYYITRGMWEEENENAAFALEIGEISPVVKSSSGYSIFLRCEKSEAYIEANTDSLADDYYTAQYNLLLLEKIEGLEIKKLEAYESMLKEESEK